MRWSSLLITLVSSLSLTAMATAEVSFMNENAIRTEITHATEGAPGDISKNASFMAFNEGRFHLIKQGKNNFTCLVIRDPKGRYEPSCLNEEAVRSILPTYEMQMRLLYEGKGYNTTWHTIEHAGHRGELPIAETGALVYMMSPNNKYYDNRKNTLVDSPVHQMYFFPKLKDKIFSLPDGGPSLWQGFPNHSALIVVVDS
jgi:hypothetical protein